jgi:hypothetical protein
MLSDLDDAAQTVDWLIRAGQNPRSGPTGAAPALRDKLAILGQVAVDVQIDGSPRAKDIAARVLHGIGDIWQETTEGKAILGQPALSQAYEAIITAHSEMIEVSRDDIGGGPPSRWPRRGAGRVACPGVLFGGPIDLAPVAGARAPRAGWHREVAVSLITTLSSGACVSHRCPWAYGRPRSVQPGVSHIHFGFSGVAALGGGMTAGGMTPSAGSLHAAQRGCAIGTGAPQTRHLNISGLAAWRPGTASWPDQSQSAGGRGRGIGRGGGSGLGPVSAKSSKRSRLAGSV